MGEVNGKVWGLTQLLRRSDDGNVQLHRITFEAGGVCSEHVHKTRCNAFYVLSGKLVVREWWSDGQIVEHYLRAHEHHVVAAGVKHQFEAIDSGVALEIYWGGPEEDIVRFTTGFMR